MCLAIPAVVLSISADQMATVDILGVQSQVALDLVPQAQIGDYVLVHAGFAIEILNAEDAAATLDLIREFPELAETAV
ncbi:MAG: HypC/HybG/HupF family hydrogenase formation chaperone [Actinomycetia bacterium]|nr:HypC/HybG/HupF family hydrogenase formation chaperone [Actinomycetes bacterium]